MFHAMKPATRTTPDPTQKRNGSAPLVSVTNADGRTWDVPNLWFCDGSLFPTSGGVNPSLTIQALAHRRAERIQVLAARGEL